MTDHTIVLHDHDKSPADLVAEAIALCEELLKSIWEPSPFSRALKTHLAEFGEHKDHSDTCGVRMINGAKSEGCKFSVTKAKRLLGVSE